MDIISNTAPTSATGTFLMDDDYSKDCRIVSSPDMAAILRNAYMSGLRVEFCHGDQDEYMAIHDNMGISYGRYHYSFPTA